MLFDYQDKKNTRLRTEIANLISSSVRHWSFHTLPFLDQIDTETPDEDETQQDDEDDVEEDQEALKDESTPSKDSKKKKFRALLGKDVYCVCKVAVAPVTPKPKTDVDGDIHTHKHEKPFVS